MDDVFASLRDVQREYAALQTRAAASSARISSLSERAGTATVGAVEAEAAAGAARAAAATIENEASAITAATRVLAAALADATARGAAALQALDGALVSRLCALEDAALPPSEPAGALASTVLATRTREAAATAAAATAAALARGKCSAASASAAAAAARADARVAEGVAAAGVRDAAALEGARVKGEGGEAVREWGVLKTQCAEAAVARTAAGARREAASAALASARRGREAAKAQLQTRTSRAAAESSDDAAPPVGCTPRMPERRTGAVRANAGAWGAPMGAGPREGYPPPWRSSSIIAPPAWHKRKATGPASFRSPLAALAPVPSHAHPGSPAMYGVDPSPSAPLGGYSADEVPIVPLPLTVEKPVIEGAWRDRPFAILFYLHFLAVIIAAGALGQHALSEDGAASPPASLGPWDISASIFIKAFLAAATAGGATAAVLFTILRRCTGGLILTSLWLSVATQVGCGAALLAISPGAGVVLIILGACTALYIFCIRRRIAFATAHVNVALAALRNAPSVFAVACGVLLLQALWVSIWGIAALGLEHLVNNGPDAASSNNGSTGGFALFVALVSFYHVATTLRNVVSFVSASIVGSWWFEGAQNKTPVRGALLRASTTSFGTLSFGALLVAIVTALRAVMNAGRNAKHNGRGGAVAAAVLVVQCLVRCLLSILETIVEWANHWAIVYAALTGLAFVPAGKAAFALFRSRGFTAIINQDLVGTALAIGGLASAGIGALAGGAVTYSLDNSPDHRVAHAGISAVLCFLLSLAMAGVISSVITNATRAVFVAWALSPGALATTHPDHLAALSVAWHEMHPAETATAGYSALSNGGAGAPHAHGGGAYTGTPAGYAAPGGGGGGYAPSAF